MLQQLDVTQWVSTVGYIGVLLIILLETGLFIAFFLPGDSLLFAVGLLASQGVFNIWILIPAMIVAAIIGYAFGYWFGSKLGKWLLKRPDGLLFRRSYLTRAQIFYQNHGGKALLLGRLLPVVRTFVPIVAGMAAMNYRRYVYFNIAGAFIWVVSITLLGYYFGYLIPDVNRYLLPIVLVVIIVSMLPGLWHVIKRKLKGP